MLVAIVAPVGRLADMLGRKALYLAGFAIFSGGSAVCGFAPDLPILDAARVLQAVGAAMLQANSVALIAHAMPRAQLGRGIGVQGAAQAIGLAIGPSIGGALLQLGNWRLIFLINVPIGVIGLALGWFLLPRSRNLNEPRPFDALGMALFLPAIASLMAALTFANDAGDRGAGVIAGLLIIAGLLGAAFVVRERRYPHPIIDLGLFANAVFSLSIVSGLLSYSVMFGTLFIVPFFLERHLGMSPALAGLQLTTLPLALGLVAPLAGHMADTLGGRQITTAGMLTAAAGLAILAVGRDLPAGRVLALAVIGAGLGAFTPANNAAVMASAPLERSGVAGGVLNMTRGLGTSLGVAFTGLVYDTAVRSVHRPAAGETAFIAAVVFLILAALFAAVLAGARGDPASPDPARRAPGHRAIDR